MFAHSVAILLVQAIDSPTKQLQQQLMRKAYQFLGDNIYEISHGNRDGDVCSGWDGILCEFGVVTRIAYYDRYLGNMMLEYLPNTVSFIELANCGQAYEIQARTLPRELESLYVYRNRIRGTFDLQSLPPKLQVINLSHNDIEGPVHLLRLPQSLRVLNLSYNSIRQETVFYDKDLPKSLTKIELTGSRSKIGVIEPIDADAAAVRFPLVTFNGLNVRRVK